MCSGLFDRTFVPLNLLFKSWSPVPSLKFQNACWLSLLTSSGSKNKEPKSICLSVAKAPHSHKTWAEVSFSAVHLLHKGLSISPIKCRCFLWVLHPIRRPVTALDCILLKDSRLVLAVGLGTEVNFRACLWVLERSHHITMCWLSIQHFVCALSLFFF
jgi:hypothetical protein